MIGSYAGSYQLSFLIGSYILCLPDKVLCKILPTLLPRGGGGTRKNFDRDPCVILLGLKFHNLFFWVAQNEGYFLGVEKISINFVG